MLAMSIYPPLSEVLTADVAQLALWSAFLPAPTSDVQRTVLSRIHCRLRLLSDDVDPGAKDGATASKAADNRLGVEDSIEHVRALLGLIGQSSAFDRGFASH
jgi:hypothetical protein